MSQELLTAEPLQAVSPEHLGRLMLSSFRFSQGSPNLQTRVLQYATHDLDFTEDDISEASEVAEEQAVQLLERGHKGIRVVDREGRSDQQLVIPEFNSLRGKLAEMIDPDDRTARENLLPAIFSDSLYRDRYYAKAGQRYVGTPDGRYFSYFVRYAMLGTATGSAEYDDMFAALGDQVLDDAEVRNAERSDLNHAVAAHAQVHPTDMEAIQDWWDGHVNWPLVLSYSVLSDPA